MKFLHFLDFGKVVTLLLQNQNICALEVFNHNSHLSLLLDKKSFWEFVKYFWRYSIFARTVWRKKLKFLHFLDVGKVLTLQLQNPNTCALEILNQKTHFPLLSAKKVFVNSLNTCGDIVFLLGQCKGKIEIFTFSECWKSCSVAIATSKYLCHLPLLSAKKSFRKFVKYFWRYSISAATVWREKLKFLHFLDVSKVVTLLLQNQNICALEFSTTIAIFVFFHEKKSLWKLVKYFWRYSISAWTVWREKLKFLYFLDVGKVVTLLLQNQNICALRILNHNIHVPLLSAKQKFLKIR